MKKLFFIFIILLITSCQNKGQNKVQLFNDYSFLLLENEKVKEKSQSESSYYFNHIEQKQNHPQVPLFKHIQHPDYSIYIGIPYNTSIIELSQTDDSIDYILKTSELGLSPFYFQTYKDRLNYITEYGFTIGENRIFLLCVSKDEFVHNSIFSKESLSSRILGKK